MPTYEYACKNCGETIEVFQSFNARPLKKHDACGGELKKVFHARGVVFKGSGFYKTDSRKSAAPDSNGKSEKSEKSDKGAKKEDKPATTASKSTSKSDD
ncbi:MAG: FmdB family transcriptional regulator [Actinobacteria bacterium]|nr:MAG: FmdB family transcriptional regulator [Actinomycetota bacterium]REK35449.1 MAG: FmdB family transcriptional regulator [Actinomycetota bacterium]